MTQKDNALICANTGQKRGYTPKSFTKVLHEAVTIKLFTKESMRLTAALQTPSKSRLSKRLQKHGCFFTHQATFHLPQGPSGPHMQLSEGGAKLLNTPNAGGNSVTSEVVSFELIRRLAGCKLAKTEMDIAYDFPDHSKKTDYVVSMSDERLVAISVTRAMRHPGKTYDYEDAARLMTKKLLCVYFSNRNVLRRDRWAQQVLHIITDDNRKARLLRKAFKKVDPELKQGVVVLVTVTKNARFLYVKDRYMTLARSTDSDYTGSLSETSSSDSEEDEANYNRVIYVPKEFCTQADTSWQLEI